MNEEKKLTDEAVKDVAGGAYSDWAIEKTEEQSPKFAGFKNNNCDRCGKYGTSYCPYNSILVAFMRLRGEDCPDRG